MDLEHEIVNYIKGSFEDSPEKAVNFLVNAWSSSTLDSNEKYEVILRYFMKNLFKADGPVKQVIELKFPRNSVSNDTIKTIVKGVTRVLNEKRSDSLEVALALITNESYKKYFKADLNTYCKLIGSLLKSLDDHECDKFDVLDDIIRELHYFARDKNFPQIFRQNVLVPLRKVSTTGKYERVSDIWNLIKSVYFSRSYDEENSSDTVMKLFSDEEITFEQMEVLIESFIISFKSESAEIVKLLNHFNEDVLSRHEANNENYLNHVKMLYEILKKHDIEVASIKKLEASFENFSAELLNRVSSSIDEMPLAEYFQVLSTIISCDPFLFVEDNVIYKLLVECMIKEKSESDMADYELLLSTVVKIFGKDINQFIKKLLSAIDMKLENFAIPKKRKRKITNESENGTKKKLKLTDGSSVTTDSFHISNIWPIQIKQIIDDIFADLNVNQTVKLWKILNDSLRRVIETLRESISENVLFKIDFISSLICQLVTSTRIHEQLVYKSSEISTAIEDFNDVQHNFYETIIKIEYNNRIMNAFLRMSYDYENFIMLYFYHYDENEKNELDSVFIADKSRIKSGEWKIIQQRIKNFGKVEEKNYSNLLMVQHFIKSKLFKVANNEDNKDFLQHLFADKEQISLLLDQKDIRLHIFNLLNDEASVEHLISDLLSKIDDDSEKVLTVLELMKGNSKMLETLVCSLLKNHKRHDTIEIVKQLPVASLSHDNKKMMIEKLLLKVEATNENYRDMIIIFSKLFKNDGYKTFFKDFSMELLYQRFSDVNKFQSIYNDVIRISLKKMTTDVLNNLEWILKSSNSMDLIQILAKSMTDVNAVATNECSIEKVNKLKLDVISYVSSKLTDKNIATEQHAFCVFSRLCSQNMQIVPDSTKEHHLNLLNKLLKLMAKSTASDDTIDVFMSTLKDAKKLNLNDEIKGGIVKTLTKHMNNIIQQTISLKEEEEGKGTKSVTIERDLIGTLSAFKSNCREECSQFMFTQINSQKGMIKDNQLMYSFKIYEILFENCEKTDRKESNTTLIKNYMRHCDKYVTARGKITDVDLLCAIYSSHIALLKCYKEKLDFLTIDELFDFHIEQTNCVSFERAEDFCKFHETVGQLLFVLGNFHQNYFKSRIPQYFKAYNKFLDAIYFFKADDKDEFSAKESSMLLRLTLQLENIMKMLMKLHSNSFSIIAPYIVSSIVNVFMKSPKMLSIGDKFKVNIKNICYQLLSTIDDKTRKHIYAMVDESAKDVYESLFRDIKKK